MPAGKMYRVNKPSAPVKKLERKVNKLIRETVETKYKQTGINDNATTTGSISLLNGLQQGDDVSSRDGNEAYFKRLIIRMHNYASLNTGIRQMHRLLLVRWKVCNGVAPAITDVLDTIHPLSLYKSERMEEFVVLYDKIVNLSGDITAAPTYPSQQLTQINKKLNFKTVYNGGNAGNVADIQTNGLFWIVLSEIPAGASAGVCNMKYRIEFTE